MPEGDTILRTARRLRPVLEGQRIARAGSRDPGWPAASLVGSQILAVESRGKHLLLHLADGRSVHSHLGMTGSWHVYAVNEPWQKPREKAALWLETEQAVCVCFSPKTLELLSPDALRRHPHLHRLGPDLLDRLPAPEELVARFRPHDPTPIGEALMNQTIVCGIGNVYKSELLFLCRRNPFVAVHGFTDDQLVELVARARELMRKNLAGFPRRTRFAADGQRVWVYGRSGEPCFVCGERIAMRRQGDLGRSTYWCPACQKA